MRKIEDIIVYCGIFIFLFWYIPTSYMNVFACDDFWFGSYVHDLGFWKTQVRFYNNWEGSYFHTFLASFPHLFSGTRVPFLCNMFSFLIFTYGLYSFFRTYFVLDRKNAITIVTYLASLVYIATTGDAEIRFWVCANFTYLPQLSFVLIFISKYHRLRSNKFTRKDSIILFITLVGIAGSKLNFILFAAICIVTHDFIYRCKIQKSSIAIFILMFILVMVNVFAPGNLIRLTEEHKINEDFIRSSTMLGNIVFRLNELLPILMYSFLTIPISIKLSDSICLSKRTLYSLITATIVGFLFESIIMHICFGDPGPKRIYITYELVVLMLIMYVFCFLINDMDVSKKRLLSVITSGFFILLNIPYIRQIGPSADFSEKAQIRNEIVISANENDTIYLPLLPDSHLLLSYFANETDWIEHVYLPYFGKYHNKVQLKEIITDEK